MRAQAYTPSGRGMSNVHGDARHHKSRRTGAPDRRSPWRNSDRGSCTERLPEEGPRCRLQIPGPLRRTPPGGARCSWSSTPTPAARTGSRCGSRRMCCVRARRRKSACRTARRRSSGRWPAGAPAGRCWWATTAPCCGWWSCCTGGGSWRTPRCRWSRSAAPPRSPWPIRSGCRRTRSPRPVRSSTGPRARVTCWWTRAAGWSSAGCGSPPDSRRTVRTTGCRAAARRPAGRGGAAPGAGPARRPP